MAGRFMALVALFTGLVLVSGGRGADDDPKPDKPDEPKFPAVGSVIPGPFHVLNFNGDRKGRYHCLVCRNGLSPVALIFARLPTDEESMKKLDPGQPLGNLVKKLDAVVAEYPDAFMSAVGVFLGNKDIDPEPIKGKMEELNKVGVQRFLFTWGEVNKEARKADEKEDPYKIPAAFLEEGNAAEAELIVVLYNKFRVVYHKAFAKDALTDKDVDEIEQVFRKQVPPPFINRKRSKTQ